jgi:O-acetylhomoserine (thiol)-lyase
MNAWITLNGIETLPLRIERHCSNALLVAQFLEKHPNVEWVSHAGLESSPYYELGKKYLPDGTGSVFTFGVKGGYESGLKMLETVELFSHVANIGDTHSLILHPASTTHRQLSKEQLITAGAGPEVVRLSIGIECAEDLIADLDQALKRL